MFESHRNAPWDGSRVAAESSAGYATDPFAALRGMPASLGDVDVDALDAEAVADGLAVVKRLEGATAALKAKLVRACTTTGLATANGDRDATSFLVNTLKLSPGEAKRTAELGRYLGSLPGTADALAAGELGVEQASEIARAAKRGVLGSAADTEAQLLDAARSSDPTALRDHIKAREYEADGDLLLRDQRRAHARRQLRTWTGPDGLGRGSWTADPVNQDKITTFLQAFTCPDPADMPDEHRRTPEQRRFDAFVQGVDVALAAGEAPTNGRVRPHVTVFVDVETLVARVADGSHVPARTLDRPLPQDTLRRLVCDAAITRLVVAGDSQVLEAGRTTREWNGAQRKAIVALDGGCRFPGCTAPAAWSEIHHVAWWERDDGPTDVDNGLLLCGHSHGLVHEGGWDLTMDPATRVVTAISPDGRTVLTSSPRGPLATTTADRRRRRRPG